MSELDEVTAYARTLKHPNRRPVDAATLIIVDRSHAVPMVLLGKRHHATKFMPGKYVFPGGRVDPSDRRAPIGGGLHPDVESNLLQKVQRPQPARARSYALTALRETFEETGILIGVPVAAGQPSPPANWDKFVDAGFLPDLSRLHLVARAITPPRYVRRFDARFFTVDATAIVHRIPDVVHSDAELVELKWLSIQETFSLDLPDITRIVLHEIETRVAAGFRHDLPVPFFHMVRGRFVRENLK